MSLINCKVKLRFTWKKYCVLSAAGADNVAGNVNDNLDGNNIFFRYQRHKNKTKSETKITPNEFRYSLKSNFAVNRLFVFAYLNREDDVQQFKTRKYYLPKGIIKSYDVIINGKNFYDQPIDLGIKWYQDIRKLAIEKGEDFNTGCLLYYEYIIVD